MSYSPIAKNQAVYNELYALYRLLHDAFGGVTKTADLSRVIKEIIRIKRRAGALGTPPKSRMSNRLP